MSNAEEQPDSFKPRSRAKSRRGQGQAPELSAPRPASLFSLLQVPHPEIEDEKATLGVAIRSELLRAGGTQEAKAARLGVAQPVVSKLERLELGGFSLERLLRYARLLGLDVSLTVSRRPKEEEQDGQGITQTEKAQA